MFNRRVLPIMNLVIAIALAPAVPFYWQRGYHSGAWVALVVVLFNLACGLAGILRRE